MAKVRSPSYPAISLKEAIEKVENIFSQNYQAPISREAAATLMGYGGLNGKSLGVLGALSKYGLIEGRGDETRVSDLAVRIIAHEAGMPERTEAIRESASRPELFKDIDARYNNGKASDAAIRAYLITQKFIPTAADAVIRTYRETKNLVQAEDDSGPKEPIGNIPLSGNVEMPTFGAQPVPIDNNPNTPPIPPLGDDPYEISISGSLKHGKIINGRFSFRDRESVNELIEVLNAMKSQLPPREPKESETIIIQRDRPDTV